jgi:hypothetical protein
MNVICKKGIVLGGLTMIFLLLVGCIDMRVPNQPFGVTGSWQGELLLQTGENDSESLTVGLNLSLTQRTTPGDIIGHIAVAIPSFYVLLAITNGQAESGIITLAAEGTAGGLPDSPIFTFEFTGTETTYGRMQGSGTYSVSDKTYSFTWWATRGESEGMGTLERR